MKLNFEREELKNNVNVTKTNYLRDLSVLVAGVLLLLCIAYAFLEVIIDISVPYLPDWVDKKIGDIYNSRREIVVLAKEDLWVQKLADDINSKCAKLPFYIKIQIVESTNENAFAIPGGFILLLRPLLESIKTNNELVYVLGHEMGHFKYRDHLRGLGRAILPIFIFSFFSSMDKTTGDLIGNALKVINLGPKRASEFAADKFGVDVLNCYYGNVSGAISFIKKLDKNGANSLFNKYLSTHPIPKDRVDKLKNYILESGYKQNENY